jgi:hypothetical protein
MVGSEGRLSVRALANLSGAIAGLLLILVGGLVPAALPVWDSSAGWELRPLMMRIISTQLALDWSAFRARFSP